MTHVITYPSGEPYLLVRKVGSTVQFEFPNPAPRVILHMDQKALPQLIDALRALQTDE